MRFGNNAADSGNLVPASTGFHSVSVPFRNSLGYLTVSFSKVCVTMVDNISVTGGGPGVALYNDFSLQFNSVTDMALKQNIQQFLS